MKRKCSILVLLLITIGSLKCERQDNPKEELQIENPNYEYQIGDDLVKFKKSVTRSNGEIDYKIDVVSEPLNYKALMILSVQLRRKYPEEFQRMKDLLKPMHLNRKIYLKDFISILVEMYYRSLSSGSKSDMDMENVKIDEKLREDYRTFVKLLEEEVMDYIVPVNFIETISGKALLGRLAGDSDLESWDIDTVKEIEASELFYNVMNLPETLSKNMGFAMEGFTCLIHSLIMYPENKNKDNSRVRKTYTRLFENIIKKVERDIKKRTYPRKSWSVIMKTIISEIPQDLREKVFNPKWKSENYLKVLDLFKNLNYNVNFFTFKKLDKDQQKFFNEFSRCPRCQRIVLESILMAIEKFLSEIIPRRDKHVEL